MCNAEEQLLNVQDSDPVVKKKLYEIMGDGCVAVKNYKKALEYYRKMLEVCPASFNCTVHVFCNTHDILDALVACLDLQ
jgi:pentatricopeptide repeat protein